MKMKTIVLVCDGMADEPVQQLEGKTPLEVLLDRTGVAISY